MRKLPLIAAASLALAAPTIAQDTATATDAGASETRDDNSDFPWGLLGLFGLLGLLGRKRDDRHDRNR